MRFLQRFRGELTILKHVLDLEHVMNLWEKGKDRRRKRILGAARRTIARSGVAALSMRRLASAADVSVATLYNLYGSKEGILDALLDEMLDSFTGTFGELAPVDPLSRARTIVSLSVDEYVREARIYRPLIAAVDALGATPHNADVLVRFAAMEEEAIAAAVEAGLLRDDVPPRLVARQIVLSYLQALRHWAIGDVTDAGFRSLALSGLEFALLAVATPPVRRLVLAEIAALGPSVLTIPFSPPKKKASA